MGAHTCDYLVANLTTSPPSSSTPGDTAETTFISSSSGGGGPTSTGSNLGYMRLSSTVMAPPSQPPPCRGRHPRWNNEMPSSVQESDSTDPLIPSPSVDSLAWCWPWGQRSWDHSSLSHSQHQPLRCDKFH